MNTLSQVAFCHSEHFGSVAQVFICVLNVSYCVYPLASEQHSEGE